MPGKARTLRNRWSPACLAFWAVLISLSACQRQPVSEPQAVEADDRRAVLDAGIDEQAIAAINPMRGTPEKCYTTFRYAWLVGDIELAFGMLTPKAKRELAANVLGYIVLADVLAQDGNADLNDFSDDAGGDEVKQLTTSFEEMLSARGIESVGDLYSKHAVGDADTTTFDQRRKNHRATLIRMTQDLGPLDTFVAETLHAVRRARPELDLNRKTLEQMGMLYGRIEDIKEVEDQARGWQQLGELDREYAVDFVRDRLGWRIDQSIPSGNYLRWGGEYRDLNGVAYPR
ncbi:MAG: hypothetical protein ACE37H_05610 [Phycisphaeraceae bacterium]